jgi:RNA polymerase sigma factor (sigma-70 family)
MGEASLPLSEHVAERIPHRALALLPDERLARLASEGSKGAFAAIYERHHQALYRYCRSIVNNDEEAKDALQNTMLSALRSLPGEQREIALKPWLFRVAHNESISVLRRRSPDTSIEAAGEIPSVVPDPAVRERLRGLFLDLRQLPERQRSALVMRELNGLNYSEIAGALDTSEAAAKQVVYEARSALHELEEGRELACETVQRAISARDGRVLRGRKLRAHLRDCDGCRSFRQAIGRRQRDLSALAPPLSAPTAVGILSGALGGGATAEAGGLGALVTGAAGPSILGSGVAKMAAVTIVAGVGVVGVSVIGGFDNPISDTAVGKHPAGAGPVSHGTDGGAHGGSGSPGIAQGSGGGAKAGGGSGGGSAKADRSSPSGSGGGSAKADGSSPGGGGSGGGSSGGGPIGTPPGHGGTPPGQGGVPPGLAIPPPGLGGTPPGQGGTPPGQAKP